MKKLIRFEYYEDFTYLEGNSQPLKKVIVFEDSFSKEEEKFTCAQCVVDEDLEPFSYIFSRYLQIEKSRYKDSASYDPETLLKAGFVTTDIEFYNYGATYITPKDLWTDNQIRIREKIHTDIASYVKVIKGGSSTENADTPQNLKQLIEANKSHKELILEAFLFGVNVSVQGKVKL